jgi:hypothetical protein
MRVSAGALFATLALACAAAGAAQPAVAAKQPAACRGSKLFGPEDLQPPAELPGALEATVLASYAVFNRPQVASDQLPPVNSTGLSLEFRISSYYPGEIRQLLALPDGHRYMAIPGFLRTSQVPPAICLPKQLRKYRPKLVEEETRRRTEPAYCVVELGSKHIFSGVECTLFSEAASSESVFTAGPGSETVVAMVPNGVSSVRVVYPSGPALTAAVSENAYMVSVPAAILREQRKLSRELNKIPLAKHPTHAQRRKAEKAFAKIFHRLERETEPLRVEWLAPGGAVLRTTNRPHENGGLVILGTLF